MRKIDRVKKRFVEEGLDVALHGRKAQRVYEKNSCLDVVSKIFCGTSMIGKGQGMDAEILFWCKFGTRGK